jgi:hypothetical protein
MEIKPSGELAFPQKHELIPPIAREGIRRSPSGPS